MELPGNDDANGWREFIEREGQRVPLELLMGALNDPQPLSRGVQSAVIAVIRKRARRIARSFVSPKWHNEGWDIIEAVMHAVDLALAQPASADAAFCRGSFGQFVKYRTLTAYRKQKRQLSIEILEDQPSAEADEAETEDGRGLPDIDELNELRRRFMEMLDGIPDPRNRQALEMRRQGYLWEEVAAALNEQVDTVRWWVRKHVPPTGSTLAKRSSR